MQGEEGRHIFSNVKLPIYIYARSVGHPLNACSQRGIQQHKLPFFHYMHSEKTLILIVYHRSLLKVSSG